MGPPTSSAALRNNEIMHCFRNNPFCLRGKGAGQALQAPAARSVVITIVPPRSVEDQLVVDELREEAVDLTLPHGQVRVRLLERA